MVTEIKQYHLNQKRSRPGVFEKENNKAKVTKKKEKCYICDVDDEIFLERKETRIFNSVVVRWLVYKVERRDGAKKKKSAQHQSSRQLHTSTQNKACFLSFGPFKTFSSIITFSFKSTCIQLRLVSPKL